MKQEETLLIKTKRVLFQTQNITFHSALFKITKTLVLLIAAKAGFFMHPFSDIMVPGCSSSFQLKLDGLRHLNFRWDFYFQLLRF